MLQVTFSVLLSSLIFWSQSYGITSTQTHLHVAYTFLALYRPTFEVMAGVFGGVYCACLSENDIQGQWRLDSRSEGGGIQVDSDTPA